MAKAKFRASLRDNLLCWPRSRSSTSSGGMDLRCGTRGIGHIDAEITGMPENLGFDLLDDSVDFLASPFFVMAGGAAGQVD